MGAGKGEEQKGKIKMNKDKSFIKTLMSIVLICVCMLPHVGINVHAAEYEVIFKAGAHGTLDGEKAVSYRLTNHDLFPDEPSVQVEQGYVFTGWSKELPKVGSNVSGKEVYVAKYGVLINGLNYTIHYVDENKVDIATARTMLGEKGEAYIARPKNIPGYTYQDAETVFTLDENNQRIYIVYRLTNPALIERNETVYENEVINQNNTSNDQINNSNQPADDNNNQEQPEDIEIKDNDQPQGNGDVDIEDNKQPMSKGETSNIVNYGIAGCGILLIVALLYMVKKKKSNNSDNKA